MIKRGIAFYLILLLTIFGILSSGLAGYASYLKSRELLVRAAEGELTAATQVFGRRLNAALSEIAHDTRLLARHPLSAKILADKRGQPASEDQLAELLAAVLAEHAEYFQVRLIDAEQNGLERVRIDRIASGDRRLNRVGPDDLQEKAHLPYVFRTLTLPRDGVYLSPISINRERGTHAGVDRPSLQIATPVLDQQANKLGVVVINVDLDSLFTLLKSDLAPDTSLYLANHRGDFLIHPDPAKAFAFDQGRRERVQDDFPSTLAVVENRGDKVVVQDAPEHDAPVVASFLRVDLPQDDDPRFVVVGLSKPLAQVTADADSLGTITLYIVLGASALAMLTAIVVARNVTEPLRQMVDAVRHFSLDQKPVPLPLDRHDEIGLLARSVDEMQRQIASQMDELHQRQLKLDHQARHDALTGLPNRMMFFDRLELALARSRRSGLRLALFYLDLDSFKEINDRLGHAAGDTVLQEIGRRLLASVREIDTVARLGGDEFVVLIDGIDDAAPLRMIAQKVLAALAEPIDCQGQPLTLGASIGISTFPTDGTNSTELIGRADDAMYLAKQGGKNNYSFYRPAEDTTPLAAD
ncbi:MAG TPA: GGDEF domain-containing protein [Rhodocyclaceae bacterium]|nr:GGDEF domain-containing protein [Rhodocyclaceae bacterium]